jgi:hypothetical protein
MEVFNMRKTTPTLNHLSAKQVIHLMHFKFEIECCNDISARTQLLHQHPELFDADILQEIYALSVLLNAQNKMKKVASHG